MKPIRCAVLAMLVTLFLVLAAPLGAEEVVHKTTFVLLVGHPSAPQGDTPTVLIEPGTVIFPGPPASAAAGGGYGSLVSKLRDSYRLASLTTERREVLDLVVGKEQRLPLVNPELEAAVTLRDLKEDRALFEIRLSAKGEVISQPSIAVMRGQWATIGSRDGEAAPYVFMLVGPWTRDDEELVHRQKDLTAPKPIDKMPPAYPDEARKAGITGIVVLRGIIGVDGAVSNIRVIESPDELLSKAATHAFASWRFEPGRDAKGKPTAYEFTITLNFRLQ